MKANVILHATGMKEMDATFYQSVNGFDTYLLTDGLVEYNKSSVRDESKELNFNHKHLFVRINNYLFPTVKVKDINQLNNHTIETLIKSFQSRVDKSVQMGITPSLGLCQYFNRMRDYNRVSMR